MIKNEVEDEVFFLGFYIIIWLMMMKKALPHDGGYFILYSFALSVFLSFFFFHGSCNSHTLFPLAVCSEY